MTFHVEFLINLIPVGEVRRPFIMNIPTSKKLITCKLGCIYTIDASVKKEQINCETVLKGSITTFQSLFARSKSPLYLRHIMVRTNDSKNDKDFW